MLAREVDPRERAAAEFALEAEAGEVVARFREVGGVHPACDGGQEDRRVAHVRPGDLDAVAAGVLGGVGALARPSAEPELVAGQVAERRRLAEQFGVVDQVLRERPRPALAPADRQVDADQFGHQAAALRPTRRRQRRARQRAPVAGAVGRESPYRLVDIG